MATRSTFLTGWVKNAYSMELGLANTLEKQARESGGDAKFQKGITTHLTATRHHAELLKDCLQRMGENPTSIQPARPIVGVDPQADGGSPDTTVKTGLVSYVTESFEVASYRALVELARQVGDQDTARICEQILRDETEMIRSLDEMFPNLRTSAAQYTGAGQHTGEKTGGNQDYARLARENFDAINSHDLNRWDRYNADDFRGQAPGFAGEMDKQRNREYLQNFLTAFPDLHFDLAHTIAQGDHVVVDWTGTGTHTGQLRTPDGQTIPPTNKRATTSGSTTFEFANGKIRRTWVHYDMSSLMQQLGLSPKA